ncbi:MAG: hypothetical protein JSR17_11400 [Proteobacteria bacterium]|nr:hypothetical protein [Pseudomonadota bacterium]
MIGFIYHPLIVTLCDYWYYKIVSPLRDKDTPELSKDEFNAVFDKTKLVLQFIKSTADIDYIHHYCGCPEYSHSLHCDAEGAFKSLTPENSAIPAEDVLRIHNNSVSAEDKIDIFIKFILTVFAPKFSSKIEETKALYKNQTPVESNGLLSSLELAILYTPVISSSRSVFTADNMFLDNGSVIPVPNYSKSHPKPGS